ncbi:MAG: bifunctional ADP-heptose synthase [bacterium]
MKKHFDLIEKFKNEKILVIGDFILDEYLYGETERISREAPVLILKYNKSVYLAGGGANPIMNIKDIGATPVPVTVVGTDKYSDIILDLLVKKGADISNIIKASAYQIPVKTRILAGSVHTVKQQIVRIDHYQTKPLAENIEKKLIENIHRLSPECSAILVSDYGGGVISDAVISVVNALAKKGKKVVVDSRYALSKFKYITTATPNETEAGPVVGMETYGDKAVDEMAKLLCEKMKATGMIVTRGSKGMTVFEKNKLTKIAPFGSDDIVDVNGAGDTVSSITAVALGAGASLVDAAFLANIGGGLVVMKRGVATVTPEELKKALKKIK